MAGAGETAQWSKELVAFPEDSSLVPSTPPPEIPSPGASCTYLNTDVHIHISKNKN